MIGTLSYGDDIHNATRSNKNRQISLMKNTIGSVLTIGGLIGLIYTGINYINESESFGFLGADVVVSRGDPIPIIVSGIVMVIGIVLLRSRN
jgi:hypothetical protein